MKRFFYYGLILAFAAAIIFWFFKGQYYLGLMMNHAKIPNTSLTLFYNDPSYGIPGYDGYYGGANESLIQETIYQAYEVDGSLGQRSEAFLLSFTSKTGASITLEQGLQDAKRVFDEKGIDFFTSDLMTAFRASFRGFGKGYEEVENGYNFELTKTPEMLKVKQGQDLFEFKKGLLPRYSGVIVDYKALPASSTLFNYRLIVSITFSLLIATMITCAVINFFFGRGLGKPKKEKTKKSNRKLKTI